mmetsp:Transcript_30848/g.26348  ORF Transcript_30848/g.26348 Transcript_30848/m.26348 type:complete len:124 (-) Transcript_30848:54-425(-)
MTRGHTTSVVAGPYRSWLEHSDFPAMLVEKKCHNEEEYETVLSQAFMGGIVGLVEALVWYFIMLFVRVKSDRFVGIVLLKSLFVHNWPAPRCYISNKFQCEQDLGGIGMSDKPDAIRTGVDAV